MHAGIVQESLHAIGFQMRAQIVWAKSQMVIGRGSYHWQHECCWFAVRSGAKADWSGGRAETTLWQIDSPTGWRQHHEGDDAHTGIHSTQKPVACMRRPMENHGKPGDAVYDPFLGSGTSIVAAELAARRCLSLELLPAYCDVAIQRVQRRFPEMRVTLDGKSFSEVAAARGVEVAAA